MTAWSEPEFRKRLTTAVRTYDRDETEALCQELIAHVYRRPDPYPADEAKIILGLLRAMRFFNLMQKAADAFIRGGQTEPQIRRQYAQAMIEQKNFGGAVRELDALVGETAASNPEENAEARGLMGRVYKQEYVDAKESQLDRNRQNLREALRWYWELYESDRAKHLWPGINVVALLRRADRDGVEAQGYPDPLTLAAEILNVIELKDAASTLAIWDIATAVEACIALDKPDEALRWCDRYLLGRQWTAFDVGSTLRQLTEVWQLDTDTEVGQRLLPLLRAHLLNREGGKVELDMAKVGRELSSIQLEKVYGTASYQTLEWYKRGLDRCHGVALISDDLGTGLGTGFLVRGSDLHQSLGGELLLVTNDHVISKTHPTALRPEQAVVTFQVLGARKYKVKEIVWHSPEAELDAALVRLRNPPGVARLPVVRTAPEVVHNPPPGQDQPRVYIIGHPGGGTLCFSLQDSVLVAYKEPRLHYRTPTNAGHSGSPLFDDRWDLLGLHHGWVKGAQKPGNEPGTYDANEGFYIGALIEKYVAEMSPAAARVTKKAGETARAKSATKVAKEGARADRKTASKAGRKSAAGKKSPAGRSAKGAGGRSKSGKQARRRGPA